MIKRVFLVVLDSFGVGYLPDASEYGDYGANTLKTVCSSERLKIPNMTEMGLFNIDGVYCAEKALRPSAAYGRCLEKSKGKDTTTGHWEIAGVISQTPFPVYPQGFPTAIIDEFTQKTGKEILCNKPYSGTKVITDYGKEHIKSGKLIVYTSADSVFQIAAHENIVSQKQLYEYCKIAREILTGKHRVGRVIARPFKGEYPNFTRTSGRHDFSLEPPETILDKLNKSGFDVIGIGKIYDIFAGKGLTEHIYTNDNADGICRTVEFLKKDFNGLCFINLVDFDMKYGHRNDIDGYAEALTYFDEKLYEIKKHLKKDDVLIITADHGCDPGFDGTDHTREYVPLLIYGKKIIPKNLGTVTGFDFIGNLIVKLLSGEDDGI